MVSTILFAGNKYLSSLPKVYLFSMQSRPVDHHLHSVREGLRVPTFSVPVTTCRGRVGTRAVNGTSRSRRRPLARTLARLKTLCYFVSARIGDGRNAGCLLKRFVKLSRNFVGTSSCYLQQILHVPLS